MSAPKLQQIETVTEQQKRNRSAKILSLILALAAALAAVSSFVEYLASGGNFIQTVLIVMIAVCGGISFFWARAGKTVRSAAFLIIPLIVLIPLFVTQTQGLGLLTGLFAVTFPMGIASLTLPPKYFRSVLLAAVVSALLAIVGDLFWPFAREASTLPLTNFSTLVAFISLVVIFFFIARNFSNYSLGAKLVTTTVIVATLAVAAVAFGINSFTRNALTTEAGKQLRALTDSQAILIGELLFRELTTLQTLSLNEALLDTVVAQNERYTGSEADILAEILEKDREWMGAGTDDPMVTAVLQNQIADELRQFHIKFPENSELLITDQYGALVASTHPTERFYLADEAWWQRAYTIGFGATYFGVPAINERSGDGFIQIALPLFFNRSDGSRVVAGVLYTNYSLKALEDLMLAAQFGETGQIRLHFPDRELAINEDGEMEIVRDNIVPDSVLAEAQLSGGDFMLIDQDGQPNLFSTATVNTLNHQPIVDELNWRVSVQQAEEEALSAIAIQQRLNILLGTLVVLAAGGVAAFVSRQLTGPIVQLTAVAEKVTAGDLAAQADISSQDELGILAKALNSMTAQVRDAITTLEDRVQDRTRALETSFEVGRRISTILDIQQLVVEVVSQVRDAFNYYHAHIYLIDTDDGDILRMVGGTGTAGQEMLASSHQLSLGTGLVGRAATTNAPVLVPDVTQAADWLPNPLLPDTKAEIAVPITLGDKVLGVLDVQHNIVQGLDQEDAVLLSSIANQIAIALENARLLAQVQDTLAKTDEQARRLALLNELSEAISRMELQEDIVDMLMQKAPEMVEASRISLHLIDEADPTMLRVAGVSGLVADTDLNEQIPLADSPMAVALEQRQLVSGVFDTGEEILQAYFAPLYASGRPLGTFNMAVPAEKELQEGDRQILMQIASVLGTTIENRQLFDETRARADREQLLNNITRKIQGTFTVESALQTAVQELSQALQTRHATVKLTTAPEKDV